jgi:hypothetical protein
VPLPGPRNQYGPTVPNYHNPNGQSQDFHHRVLHQPVAVLGESPGLMMIDRRLMVLAAGQVRKLWRQAINELTPAEPYDQVSLTPGQGRPAGARSGPVDLTRALRYKTRSLYMRGGNDNTHFSNMHTVITKQNRGMPVTLGAGTVQNRPTVRNRMTSFGSRVPILNSRVPAAENLPGE